MLRALARWLSSHGFCAVFGVFVGAIVGGIYGPLLQEPSLQAAALWQTAVAGGVMGALVGLVGLFILGVILHYEITPLWLGALGNGLLTGALTAVVLQQLGVPTVGAVVGILIGFIIGKVLCMLCHRAAWLKEGQS